MKEITKVRQHIKRCGTIEDTELFTSMLSDNEIEVRVRYTIKPKKKHTVYSIFKKCRDIIYGDEQ